VRIRERYPYRRIREAVQGATPEDAAAALQAGVEAAMARFVQRLLRDEPPDPLQSAGRKPGRSPHRNLAAAGGIFANCLVNMRLLDLPGVMGLHIFPHMGDGGLAAGAALWAWHRALSGPELNGSTQRSSARHGQEDRLPHGRAWSKLDSVFLGTEYVETRMLEALEEAGLSWCCPADLAAEVACLLAEGKTVARFTGREEFGPRALGHRSILFTAGDPKLAEKVNAKLGRDWFMPFASATLVEAAEDLFKDAGRSLEPARFMTITAQCTSRMRNSSPAAVHLDGTSRVQIVTREDSPGLHGILTAYRKRTGIPTLINTSFNLHCEPIVHTPEEGVRTFLEAGLDSLVMGPFLVHLEARMILGETGRQTP